MPTMAALPFPGDLKNDMASVEGQNVGASEYFPSSKAAIQGYFVYEIYR